MRRTSPGSAPGAALLCSLAYLANASAQDSTGKVTIDELRSPTSPAFTILGSAPTNVVRPNTPRELAVEVLSANDRRNDGQLPSDLALEIAPYWLANHPELTFEDYYAPKGIGQTILRSLSVSLATSKIPDETIDGTSLGLGLRFHLVPGKKAPDLEVRVSALKEAQLAFLDCSDFIDTEAAGESVDGAKCADLDGLQRTINEAGAAVRMADKQRVGWVVEAAFAVSRDYPSADGATSHARQRGAWFTASYKVSEPSSLTLLVVGRLLEDRTGLETVRMTDAGGRFIWESPTLPISLSLEVMHRDIERAENGTSVLGVLEYPISDSLRLVASYGRGLPTPTQDSDLQATIGVNFGFGKGPSVSFDNLTKDGAGP